ncbi:MAG TPA: hypothetical protein VEB18_01260 [Candidatus Paceibacterota bacterium]|nr:hypothetical protein [Candidatus Paceibacterota bacterium]
MKPFQGSTQECFAHFAEQLASDYEYHRKRKVFAATVHVTDGTVQRWFSQNGLPMGEALVRVRYYLDFLGYAVAEVQELPEAIRTVGHLITFDVLSVADVAGSTGYEGVPKNNVDQVIAVLCGRRGVSEEKFALYSELARVNRKRLTQRQQAVEKVVSFEQGHCPTEPESFPTARPESDSHRKVIIESFVHSVEAILPLAEDVLSDGFTAADRAKVRDLVGSGISRLSNLLTQLTSEGARNTLKKQQ